jgi:hypothetical protein
LLNTLIIGGIFEKGKRIVLIKTMEIMTEISHNYKVRQKRFDIRDTRDGRQ